MIELALWASVPLRTVILFSQLMTFHPSIFGRSAAKNSSHETLISVPETAHSNVQPTASMDKAMGKCHMRDVYKLLSIDFPGL